MGEGLGVRVIETKNPLFEKTGILKFTTPDGETYVYSAASALTSERTINGKTVKVVEFASLEKDENGVMAFSLDTLHTGFPVAWLIAQGYDKPFSQEALKNFPTWAIQFHYHPENATKDAVLWPRSGKTAEYFRYLQDQNKDVVWFFVTDEQGNSFFTLPFLTLNPKDPKAPQADETMFIFGALGTITNQEQFERFKGIFLVNHTSELKRVVLERQPLIYLAQEGVFFEKNPPGIYSGLFNRSPLDQLLGREGNDVGKVPYQAYKKWGTFHYSDIFNEGFNGSKNSPQKVYERPMR